MTTSTDKVAICYGRFSTSEQSKGFSLERQKASAIEFATRQNWSVEKTLFDEGRSAFHGANRLEGSVLHEFELEARNGLHRGKVLVCENIDRLSRQGAKAAAQLIWSLNEHGVDVATYHDGHIYGAGASSDMMDLFRLIIIGEQAHSESLKKSVRTAANWQAKFDKIAAGESSVVLPNTPHWIERKGGTYVLHPYRTKILNEIFDLYIDGQGIDRIAGILNKRGEPVWTQSKTRNVNGWFYGYIWRLLTKRAAIGEYVNKEGETLAPHFYPQAIPTDKWNRAQAVLGMRKTNQKRSRNQNRNLLTQMVFCAECGGGAHFEHTTDNVQTYRKVSGEVVNYRRKTYRRMRCDRSRRRFQCENKTILNYDVIEGTVMQELERQLIVRPDHTAKFAQQREDLANLIRQRDTDQKRIENLIDALAEGTVKGITQRIVDLETSIGQQDEKIEKAKRQLEIEETAPSTDDDMALVAQLQSDLTSEDEDIRIYARGRVNLALRRLIHKITINPNGTFTVYRDELAWFDFDETGHMIEGNTVWEIPRP